MKRKKVPGLKVRSKGGFVLVPLEEDKLAQLLIENIRRIVLSYNIRMGKLWKEKEKGKE